MHSLGHEKVGRWAGRNLPVISNSSEKWFGRTYSNFNSQHAKLKERTTSRNKIHHIFKAIKCTARKESHDRDVSDHNFRISREPGSQGSRAEPDDSAQWHVAMSYIGRGNNKIHPEPTEAETFPTANNELRDQTHGWKLPGPPFAHL